MIGILIKIKLAKFEDTPIDTQNICNLYWHILLYFGSQSKEKNTSSYSVNYDLSVNQNNFEFVKVLKVYNTYKKKID